jgi:inhibitor of KinA sporulation pathway (predicted exonuclease)
VKLDYDRSRLSQKLIELQSERDLLKSELSELELKHTSLLTQNERLKDQLRILEQESYEIQARVRRGIEVERENENISRSVEQQREKELRQGLMIEELRGTIRSKDQDIERLQGKNETIGYHQRQLE